MKKCPKCKILVHDKLRVCFYCGYEFDERQTDEWGDLVWPEEN